LRSFHRKGQGKLAPEVLDDAEGVLPRPGESHVILRVNRQRNGLPASLDSLLILRCQGPSLAAGNAETVIKSGLRPNLALAHHVAVALAVIGSNSSTQPVRFVIAGQLGAANLALRE